MELELTRAAPLLGLVECERCQRGGEALNGSFDHNVAAPGDLVAECRDLRSELLEVAAPVGLAARVLDLEGRRGAKEAQTLCVVWCVAKPIGPIVELIESRQELVVFGLAGLARRG